MQMGKGKFGRGGANPVVVVAVILIAAAVAVGAWYYFGRESNPLGENVQVMVNGKAVDPKSVIKDGTIQLKGGGSFTLGGSGIDPGKMMSDTMKAYFDLPAGAARTKYLDDMIDRQEAARKELGITDTNGPQVKLASDKPGASPGTQPSQKIQIRATGGGGDSMPPELRAQLAEFAAAMSKRRAERGLPPQQGMMMIRTKKTE